MNACAAVLGNKLFLMGLAGLFVGKMIMKYDHDLATIGTDRRDRGVQIWIVTPRIVVAVVAGSIEEAVVALRSPASAATDVRLPAAAIDLAPPNATTRTCRTGL